MKLIKKFTLLLLLWPIFLFSETINLLVENDTDYLIAKDIVEITKKDMNLSTYSGDCFSNMQKVLTDPEGQFAIIPYDALIYKRDIQKDEKFTNKLKMIFPLYDKEIHIIVRKDRGIETIKDLDGKRVNADRNCSNIFITGEVIKKYHNVNWKRYSYTPRKAIEKLLEGEIDAMIFVVNKPFIPLLNIPKEKANIIKLIPSNLDKDYQSSYISSLDYPWVEDEVRVNTVKQILITYDYYYSDKIARFNYYTKNINDLVSILSSNMSSLRQNGHKYWKDIKPYYYTQVKWPLHSIAKEALLKNMDKTDIFTNTIGVKFTKIPSGHLKMGNSDKSLPLDEKPETNTKMDSFYIATTEVTQMQWDSLMKNNPSFFNQKNLKYHPELNPVENISFNEALEFIDKLNSFEKRDNYRLPTEKEWEYIAKDENITTIDDYAWYATNSNSTTHRVGLKKPNSWGLYDTLGNVWEWCDSYYTKDYSTNAQKENFKILRGGSWINLATNVRAENRMKNREDIKRYTNGFRLVYDLNPKSDCNKPYKVKRGDTLSNIADKAYRNSARWDIIFYDNKSIIGKNPSKIVEGQILNIPCIKKVTFDVAVDKTTKNITQNTIKLIAETNFKPFLSPNLPHNGMAGNIVEEIFNSLNDNDYTFTMNDDFSTHKELLKEFKYDVGIAWYKPNCNKKENLSQETIDRCNTFYFSKPLFETLGTIYKKSSDKFIPKLAKDLYTKKICRPKGWYTFDLEEKGLIDKKTVTLIRPNTPKECFNMLIKDEVDYVALDNFAGVAMIKEMNIDSYVESIETITSLLTLHLVVTKENPRAKEILNKLNQGIENIEKSGKLKQIQTDHLSNFFNNSK